MKRGGGQKVGQSAVTTDDFVYFHMFAKWNSGKTTIFRCVYQNHWKYDKRLGLLERFGLRNTKSTQWPHSFWNPKAKTLGPLERFGLREPKMLRGLNVLAPESPECSGVLKTLNKSNLSSLVPPTLARLQDDWFCWFFLDLSALWAL